MRRYELAGLTKEDGEPRHTISARDATVCKQVQAWFEVAEISLTEAGEPPGNTLRKAPE